MNGFLEFLSNCWQAVMNNKDQILLFFTSGQFLALVVAIINLARGRKSTKQNTLSIGELKESVNRNEQLATDVNSTLKTCGELVKTNGKLVEAVENLDSRVNSVLGVQTEKINAIIEVQSIVYSSIKDEKVRNTVNNLLLNAKYSETVTRNELKRQVEELRKQVAEKTAELNKFVESTTNTVKSIVSEPGKEESYEEITRY